MLTPNDIAQHEALGITAAMLQRARVTRRDDADARDLLGLNGTPGDFAGIEYPYLSPRSGRPVSLRLRLDHPPLKADGTPDQKYRQPRQAHALRHLFFAPGAAALLATVTAPVAIAESEKGALAIASAAERAGRALLVIALGGCWNFRGTIGKTTDARGSRVDEKGVLPDFHLITWTTRRAVIAFDARPNGSVQAARRELAPELRGFGADVQHAHLPDDDPRVNGPDDFIGRHGDDAFWRVFDAAQADDFLRDKEGRIIPHALDNVRRALDRLHLQPTFDEFRRVLCLNGVPLTDVDLDLAWVRINDAFGFRPSLELLRRVVTTEAQTHRVHPVRQYLDGLMWDGTPRLDTWLIAYGGATDSAYVRAVGALPLLAAVCRVHQPGAKFDELLVLEGNQGTNKSSAVATLSPRLDWFSDDLPLGEGSKETIERTGGRWLIEAAELHGNRGREAEQLKAFLSRCEDGPVRLAYERFAVAVPRQFVVIGTTNATAAYLKDGTGGRRFWPVRIARFDITALARDRDQLWAEAAARVAQGDSIRLDPSLWQDAATEQEQRRAADPWEDVLSPLLEGDGLTQPAFVSATTIWQTLGVEANIRNNQHADRIATILQRYGFAPGRLYVDGKQVRAWIRTDGEAGA